MTGRTNGAGADRAGDFSSDQIIQASADGIAHKPETAFGNIKTDVLAEKLPGYQRPNFCDLIRSSKHTN